VDQTTRGHARHKGARNMSQGGVEITRAVLSSPPPEFDARHFIFTCFPPSGPAAWFARVTASDGADRMAGSTLYEGVTAWWQDDRSNSEPAVALRRQHLMHHSSLCILLSLIMFSAGCRHLSPFGGGLQALYACLFLPSACLK
jgi:hypothetical protein